MSQIKVTVKYGLTRSVTIEKEIPVSIGDILCDENVMAVLGAPESVMAVINGVAVGDDHYVNDGDVIQLEKQAAQKAA